LILSGAEKGTSNAGCKPSPPISPPKPPLCDFQYKAGKIRAQKCRCLRRTNKTGRGLKAFKVVSRIAARFERVVQRAENFGGFN